MAHYKATVETARAPEDVFAYLSDFSTAAEWDPGTIECERLGDGPIGIGTEFRLLASFLGRKSTLTYTIIAYDPPRQVTFRGENATVVSLDRIDFEPLDSGTRVVYDAELTLKGPAKLADPLLGLAFKRVGDQALDGMRATLGAGDSERP
jgi:carbon monoxide dehydrogenase subunit G